MLRSPLTFWFLSGIALAFAAACDEGGADSGGRAAGGSDTGGAGGGGASTSSGTVDPSEPFPYESIAHDWSEGDVVRGAIFLASCANDEGADDTLSRAYSIVETGEPSTSYGTALIRATPCLASKTSGCSGVDECVGVGFQAPVDDICDAGSHEECSGDSVVGCKEGLAYHADCAKLGFECDASSPYCGKPTPACDRDTYVTSCEGGRPHSCDASNSETIGVQCDQFGLECVADLASKTAHCAGAGAACEVEPAHVGLGPKVGVGCDGGNLRSCNGGKEQLVDCAALYPGFSCQSEGELSFCGFAADCDPDQEPSCDGDELTLCNAGRLDTVDCKELGFFTCGQFLGNTACM